MAPAFQAEAAAVQGQPVRVRAAPEVVAEPVALAARRPEAAAALQPLRRKSIAQQPLGCLARRERLSEAANSCATAARSRKRMVCAKKPYANVKCCRVYCGKYVSGKAVVSLTFSSTKADFTLTTPGNVSTRSIRNAV